MPGSDPLIIRSASGLDKSSIKGLIQHSAHIHQHLDWTSPLERIMEQPFLVAEHAGEVLAVLACPPDPKEIAWLKLFVSGGHAPPEYYWGILWEQVQSDLKSFAGLKMVAAIPFDDWFERLLIQSGFSVFQEVILFEWSARRPPVIYLTGTNIRPVNNRDLEAIVAIDHAAFEPVWKNSYTTLERALVMARYSTVLVVDEKVVGYQISTDAPKGGHLARLAIQPGFQSRRYGYALVLDMQDYFFRSGAGKVTVNTQNDNFTSIALYQKAGFKKTGMKYPVYGFPTR